MRILFWLIWKISNYHIKIWLLTQYLLCYETNRKIRAKWMKHIYQSIRVLSLKAYWWFYRVKYAVLKVQCRKFEPYFPVF